LGATEQLLGSLVITGFYLGEVDYSAALAAYREGLAIAERVGHRALVNQFTNNIGYTAFIFGDWDDALEKLDRALAEDLGGADRAWLLSNALIVRANRGEDVSAGLAELDGIVSAHGETRLQLPTLDTRANDALARGEFAEARRAWLDIALLDAGQAPAAYYQAGQAAVWDKDLDGARIDLAALDARGVHGKVVHARGLSLRAAIAGMEGRHTEAVSHFHDALAAWRELGATWDEAVTGISAVITLDPPDKQVRAIAESTRSILERLGARPYIERLDEALAGRDLPEPAAARRDSAATRTGELV
jgi:tetratricopeptide (TPR) repeat protein